MRSGDLVLGKSTSLCRQDTRQGGRADTTPCPHRAPHHLGRSCHNLRARAHACAFPLRRGLPQILPPWGLPGDKEASLPEGRAGDPEGKGADQAPGGSSCPRPRPAPAQALPTPRASHPRPLAPRPPRSLQRSTWSPSASAGPPACSRSPGHGGRSVGPRGGRAPSRPAPGPDPFRLPQPRPGPFMHPPPGPPPGRALTSLCCSSR